MGIVYLSTPSYIFISMLINFNNMKRAKMHRTSPCLSHARVQCALCICQDTVQKSVHTYTVILHIVKDATLTLNPDY
jgi:hypothetical protein